MKEMKKIAADTLSLLGQNGAEKASVSVVQRQTREFNVDSGKFSLFRTLYDRALGAVDINGIWEALDRAERGE